MIPKKDSEAPLTIVWAAFLVAPAVYAVAGWVLDQGERTPINLELLNWIQVFLGMASGLVVLTVFLLRQLLAAVTRRDYRTYCILRWALLESIAVFGLAQFLLGGHFEVLLLFLAVSALSVGAARPGPSDRAAWEHQFE